MSQKAADRFHRPGEGGELLELLVVDARAFGHGLHGFALPVEHEPLQLEVSLCELVLAGQGGKDLFYVVPQFGADRGELGFFHAPKTAPKINRDRVVSRDGDSSASTDL